MRWPKFLSGPVWPSSRKRETLSENKTLAIFIPHHTWVDKSSVFSDIKYKTDQQFKTIQALHQCCLRTAEVGPRQEWRRPPPRRGSSQVCWPGRRSLVPVV